MENYQKKFKTNNPSFDKTCRIFGSIVYFVKSQALLKKVGSSRERNLKTWVQDSHYRTAMSIWTKTIGNVHLGLRLGNFRKDGVVTRMCQFLVDFSLVLQVAGKRSIALSYSQTQCCKIHQSLRICKSHTFFVLHFN